MSIPFTRFRGPLKRLELSHLSANERVVFEALFPRFLEPLFGSQVLPRRFAGFRFPRRRYYTLCLTESGNDDHTLAHELRAYRNPATSGMVEVVDLTEVGGITFASGERIELRRGHALGVLVHDLERMPPEYQGIERKELRSRAGEHADLIRLPFVGYEGELEQVIDLRLPHVRDWFLETFRDRKAPDGLWWADVSDSPEAARRMMEDAIDSVIAHSRFHLERGRAPLPNSFAEMLPTLVNPDLGGGGASSTGSTLHAIGHWLRAHGAEGLIYPSARSDAFVRRGGREFSGWCLVDYRNVAADRGVSWSAIVSSPWCWTALPRGVLATFTDDGFSVDGMVRYWAEDYLHQVHSMRLAESELALPPRALGRFTDFEAWKLGVWLLRWLSIAIASGDVDRVQFALRMLTGLAVRHDLYRLAGRAQELLEALRASADGNAAVGNARLLADDIATVVGGETETVIRAGIGFETLVLTIVIAARWGQPGQWDRVAFATAPEELALPSALGARIRGFLRDLREARPPFRDFLDKADEIEDEISKTLYARSY